MPEGMIGNDRPLTRVMERWYSQELGADVENTSNDPRMGTRTTLLTDITLGEPDPNYFQVPEGYKVVKRQPGLFSGIQPMAPASQPVRVSTPETPSNEP